jgi:hypothetical protein
VFRPVKLAFSRAPATSEALNGISTYSAFTSEVTQSVTAWSPVVV